MTELSKIYDPKQVEERVYGLWEQSGFFNPDKLPGERKKTYVVMIAPPNVTAPLHMGHALENTISDILVRCHRMKGYKTLWMPGTDHAGIATQNVVEKELRKEGVSRFDLGREKFVERVWQWKEKYGDIILGQLKKLGASCDWSRTRFTMDEKYAKAVEAAFLHYYKKGWIYQGERTINWCARCGTSLSDLEIEYREENGKFYYIKYGPLVLGTVRPETKLGDTALAVNPKDKRYNKYVGQEITVQSVDSSSPRDSEPRLKEIKIKVVADEAADPKFGTGVIKVTPAHDLTDFEIYQRHPEIPILRVIGEDGRMNQNAGARYEGLKVLEAREQIVADMRKLGLMEKIDDYQHNVATCYRCGAVIEPMLSKQWFLKMDELAKIAIKAVKSGKVKFHPKRWEKLYFDWLKNIKDWCVSRQIWWGHRLPVWYCQTGKLKLKIKNEKLKINEYFISSEKPDECPICKECQPKQIDDVLDTWFSSALWPFATLGWPVSVETTAGKPEKTRDLKTFYPADFVTSAREIINLWIARMIFSGFEFMGKEPFKNYYIHATVLTKEGKRMSKSLGTGIDPINLIEKYGADATRFGIAWQVSGGQDIRFVEDNIIMGRKFCNKVWNAARFVLQQISNAKLKTQNSKLKTKNLTNADKKILSDLSRTIMALNKNIEHFQFGKAAQTLYDFFWHDFCDVYIEKSKSEILNPKSETKKILLHVLFSSLKLLHPFMPFITEEIYQQLPISDKKKCIMVEDWPK